MYNYISRHTAPRTVEFYTPTPQGHRIVRIYLGDTINPRVLAFNESDCKRSPALLYMEELETLIKRACGIIGEPQDEDH